MAHLQHQQDQPHTGNPARGIVMGTSVGALIWAVLAAVYALYFNF